MGWRDREYARMTASERRRFFGASTAARGTRGARSATSLLLIVIVAIIGMVLLPHLTIHGRHYHVFIL
jgi:hypothetical protein